MQYLKAFAVGGGICLIAQIIINVTDLTAGKILVYFMLAGVVLTAIGVYQPLVEFAGAGATVPISGFGYLLALEQVPESIARFILSLSVATYTLSISLQ
ncbi:MAG: SpoVA/SpoVAEb family sporulation membrane protein, partial [Clostridia bacterium]|nr:SpoVA/SpoVAEb family sporulation membrane protein [Clostridia bacterium]